MSNSKIRVLHVVGGMRKAGTETLIMNIFRKIDRSKFEFEFLYFTDNKTDYDDEIIRLGGKIHRIELQGKPYSIVKLYKEMRVLLINTGPYDVIHSHLHHYNGVILKIAKSYRVPVRIAHSHNTSSGKHITLIRNLYEGAMRKLIRENATQMIGCSKEACEELFGVDCWNDKRVYKLLNGIDINEFFNAKYDKTEIRKELGLPTDAFIIGHVGRFAPQKNHEFLIDTFIEFSKLRGNASLVLVGEGRLKSNINNYVTQKNIGDRVSFLGIRDDIAKVMTAFDIFVFPSIFEGLGLVLVEAQAVGLRCIASDVIPKDVNAGNIDFLNLEKGSNYWAKFISNIIDQEEKRLEKKDFDKFDIDKYVKIIAEIYSNK